MVCEDYFYSFRKHGQMLLFMILIIVGIAVGALTGMTGSSGVLVVVPALSLLGLSFQQSVGSSLLVDVITTAAVIYVYLRHGTVMIKNATYMGLGAVLGAQVGTRFAVSVSALPLEIAFTFLTGALALQMFRKAINRNVQNKKVGKNRWNHSSFLALALSAPVGFLTGTLGTSGGIMFIGIAMLLFSLTAQEMVGTATMAMLFSAFSGVAGYAFYGRIDYLDAIIIGMSSLISGFAFSFMAHRLPEKAIFGATGTVFITVIIIEIFKIIL